MISALEGRVAVITGGGSGLGGAMFQRFGQQGMRVVLADVMPDRVEQAAKELSAEGLDLTGIQSDVIHGINAFVPARLAGRRRGPPDHTAEGFLGRMSPG